MIGNKKTRKLLGVRNGIKVFSKLTAKTKIKQTSKERYAQNQKEKELKQKLLVRCKGLCEKCKQKPDWRGLTKHEKVFRSHGGDPLDENNTLLLCGRCHNEMHHIKEVRNGH